MGGSRSWFWTSIDERLIYGAAMVVDKKGQDTRSLPRNMSGIQIATEIDCGNWNYKTDFKKRSQEGINVTSIQSSFEDSSEILFDSESSSESESESSESDDARHEPYINS